jgi:hypothetical protein
MANPTPQPEVSQRPPEKGEFLSSPTFCKRPKYSHTFVKQTKSKRRNVQAPPMDKSGTRHFERNCCNDQLTDSPERDPWISHQRSGYTPYIGHALCQERRINMYRSHLTLCWQDHRVKFDHIGENQSRVNKGSGIFVKE